MIRAILARDEDWGIGKNGGLPWPHNPEDLRWFKETTFNNTVIMGRLTWLSLPRRPLPGRPNIVVTSQAIEGVSTVSRWEDIPRVLDPEENHWVIGGAGLVDSWLPVIQEIWLSVIPGVYDCDVFLPRDRILAEYDNVERFHYLGRSVQIEKYRRRV